MRKLNVLLIVLVVLSVMGSALAAPSAAQDTNNITCDSDLVMLWYLAERYFSFSAVETAFTQTEPDPSRVLILERFNRGELSPLFDALRNAQDPNTMTLPGVTLSPEWIDTVSATLLMDDAAFQDFMNSMQSGNSVAALVPAATAGESAECAQLRGHLQRFFAAVTFQDVQSGFTSTIGGNLNGNVNTNVNTNENANTNANANDNVNVNTNDNTGDNSNDNANVNTNDNTGDNSNDNANVNTNTNDNNDDNVNVNTNTNDNSGDNSNDNANVNNNDNDDNGGNDNNGGGGNDNNDDNGGNDNNGGGGNDNNGNSGPGNGNDNGGGNDNNGNSGSG